MFPRISSLASPSPTPLNYATPPRSTPHHISQNTPDNLSRANHATKALNFSSPSPFHMNKTMNEPESPWRTPHSSQKQASEKPIIQWSSLTNHELNSAQAFTTISSSSVLATPESITCMTPDPLNSSLDLEGLGSRHQQIINDSGKRGRPRADVITHLILEGSSSPSGIKCRICNRVFPREKSLQAHIRTHTGEKPYTCDYPGCSKSFRQSGQLKTHQRLHAGEKPFACSAPGCGNRYTHANRTCPAHPYHKPQRTSDLILQPNSTNCENTGNDEVSKWLENYRRERQDKTPTPGKIPPADASTNENFNSSIENLQTPPSSIKRSKTKRGLASDFLEQENSPLKKEFIDPRQQLSSTGSTSSLYNSNFFVQSQPISFALSSAPKSPLRLSSAPRSPMRVPGSPLALITNNNKRSLLEERLNLRKTLGDITPANNGQTFASSNSNKGSIGVLLAAAAKESTSSCNNTNNLIIVENEEDQPGGNSSDSNGSTGKPGIIQCLTSTAAPRSPLKSLKPKKRWLKTVFQENVINQANDENSDENLAMPIKWNEAETDTRSNNVRLSPKNGQYSLFRNPGSNVLRRSPLSMSIASTLVALHSSSPDKEERHDEENDSSSNNQPLNLSKRN